MILNCKQEHMIAKQNVYMKSDLNKKTSEFFVW